MLEHGIASITFNEAMTRTMYHDILTCCNQMQVLFQFPDLDRFSSTPSLAVNVLVFVVDS
jgi:hypothetical protein